MKGVPVGHLRTRFDVQVPVITAGDYNVGTPTSWTSVKTVWGAVSYARGRELTESGRVEGRLPATITLRYDADLGLTTRHRLVDGSRVFHVKSVGNRYEGNRYFDVEAEEVAEVPA